jgi:hypothetical protein
LSVVYFVLSETADADKLAAPQSAAGTSAAVAAGSMLSSVVGLGVGLKTSPVAAAIDPLALLAKQLGGSKRNALLRWCQNRTASYAVRSRT